MNPGPRSPGMLLIISGPSGVGKTTITRAVESSFAGDGPGRARAVFSVSATTRPKSAVDREGVDYHFVDDPEFDRLVREGAFLEWANVFGKRYGTLRHWVADRLAEGRLVILEIDVQGAANVKRQIPDAFGLFVLPPSEDVLLDRLRARKREPEEAIQRRFAAARAEIAAAHQSGVYDRFVVNDDLPRSTREALEAVGTELQRRGVLISEPQHHR